MDFFAKLGTFYIEFVEEKKDHPTKINAISIGLITDALDILYMNYFVIKTLIKPLYLLIHDQQFRLLNYDFEPN